MPKECQRSVTINKKIYKHAEDYVKKHKLKSVANFVSELILEKTSKESK